MDTVATLKGLRCPQCGSEDLDVKGKAGSMGKELAGAFLGGAIAHLAVSRSASKNVETVPIAYVCKNCCVLSTVIEQNGHLFSSRMGARPAHGNRAA